MTSTQTLAAWLELIERWSAAGQLSWAAEQGWGNNELLTPVRELEDRTSKGDTSWVPTIKLGDSEAPPPQTASYDLESQTIKVNTTWHSQASETEIITAFTQALGSYLDSTFNPQRSSSSDGVNVFSSVLTELTTQASTGSAESREPKSSTATGQ